jgi:hypothetical protein
VDLRDSCHLDNSTIIMVSEPYNFKENIILYRDELTLEQRSNQVVFRINY